MKVENRQKILTGIIQAVNSPLRHYMFFESPKRFCKYVKPGQTVLDLGCGGGYFLVDLAKRVGANGTVYAVDIEELCIGLARKKISKHPELNIKTYVASATDLHMLEDASVDFILSYGLLCMMPLEEQEAAILEMKRVLKPGGRILLYAAVEPNDTDKEFKITKLTEGVLTQEFSGRSTVNESRWRVILEKFDEDDQYEMIPKRFHYAMIRKKEADSENAKMKGILRTTVINAAPEEIWPYLLGDRISEWQRYSGKSKMRYITKVESNADKYKVGTIALMDASCHYEVADCILNKMVKYKIYERNFLGYFEGYVYYYLKSEKKGTRMIYATTFSEMTEFAAKLVHHPIMLRWMVKMTEAELRRLKRLVEEK